MAFFSSSAAYDGAQLRRKLSLSRERPSLGDHPSDESSPRKRSPSASVAPAAESSEFRPPLPTPVSAGLLRPRSSARPEERPIQQSSYEQSSTPIPFTKPVKRNSPPPFSNLIIDVSKSTSRASPPSTNERTKRSEKKLPSSAQPEASSSSALRTTPRLDNEHPVALQDVKPSYSQKNTLPNFTRSKSHSPTRSRSAGHASASTFKRTTQIEGASSKTFGVLDATPGNMPSSSSKTHTRNPTLLLTPVSPHQSRSTTRAQSVTKHVEHSRSRSNPQPPSSPSPVPDTTRAKRVPVPSPEHHYTQSPPPPVPSSSSGTSTPTHDATKKQEKRSRNVLRKPSLSKREPTSAPSSDSERKSKTHRPRTRSGVFAVVRRNSSAGLFDFIHPSPATTNLTPAGEILVAYKESQRGASFNSSRDTSFGNSGKLVAVGAPDDEIKSPWTPGWRSVRSHEEDAEDGEKKGLRHSLSRKLSERWSGRDTEHPRPLVGARRSASGGVAEFPQQEIRRSTKRPTSSGKESKAHRSPKSVVDSSVKHHDGWPQMGDEGEGRVWEEDVGEFAFSHSRSKETSESSSPGRLWKLVKRFSSGNLKDKSSPPLNPPPPVPPLPKELTFVTQTSPDDVAGSPNPGEISIPQVAALETPGIMRYITSMPSLSVPWAKTVQPRPTSAHRRAILGSNTPARPSTSDVSTHASHHTGPRRSTTTRSSSPSSENTRLFSRSRTSSDSSYGETMPPMPETYVHQHIVPPHELYRLVNSKEGDTTTTSQLPSSAQKLTAPATPGSPSSSSGSTTIPNFEVKNVSNAFTPYKNVRSPNSSTAPTTHFPEPTPPTSRADQASESRPPPIPLRNPRRPSSLSGPSFAMLAGQQSLPNVIPVQESSESETTDIEVLPRRAKARPRSISDGAVIFEPVKSPSTARSPMTFREMTTTKRPLTEQEKNAKWEDLLKRSAMAGGTLHVGSQSAGGLALWSDRASLAPSETLDRF